MGMAVPLSFAELVAGDIAVHYESYPSRGPKIAACLTYSGSTVSAQR